MNFTLDKLTPKKIIIILVIAVVLLIIVAYTNQSYHSMSPALTQKPSESPAPTVTVTNTPPTALSPLDTEAKNSLLQRLLHGVNQSGIVYKSSHVQVEYIASDNIFQAEILTAQVAAAKTETEIWFQLQGFSQTGVCKLLFFYINPEVKENLPASDAQVSLLPDGC